VCISGVIMHQPEVGCTYQNLFESDHVKYLDGQENMYQQSQSLGVHQLRASPVLLLLLLLLRMLLLPCVSTVVLPPSLRRMVVATGRPMRTSWSA